MNEAQAAALRTVTLPDAEYARIGEERGLELGLALSSEIRSTTMPPPGTPPAVPDLAPVFALGAPKRVQLTREPALPVLLAARRTGLRRWQVDPAQNLRIFAVDLGDGSVMTNLLHVSPKRQVPRRPSMTPPAPSVLNAASVSTGVTPFANVLGGLRGFGKPWPRGRHAFTVVELDQVSNTVVVTMTGGGGAPSQPPEAAPSPTLLVRRDEVSMDHEGVDFRLPPPPAKGAVQQVQVALSLPAASTVLARSTQDGSPLLVGSLLLLKLDAEQPLRVDLAIPVRLPSAEGRVRTLFSFDLGAALKGGLPSGRWQTYLVIGDTVAGPRVLDAE